jgi:hypothetical protein
MLRRTLARLPVVAPVAAALAAAVAAVVAVVVRNALTAARCICIDSGDPDMILAKARASDGEKGGAREWSMGIEEEEGLAKLTSESIDKW